MDVLLSQLVYGGKIDSRSKGSRGVDIDTLANSIRTLGLILPLAVIPDGEEKYRVVDGNRRLEALKIVHKGKKDVIVPVLLHDADLATARAQSLAANIERLPLHPVDQFEAFAAIAAEGKSLEDIAAAFGINVRQVEQRLALGTLYPKARQLYRAGKLDAEDARQLTKLSLRQQGEVLDLNLNHWQLQQAIRDISRVDAIAANSEIAKFVTRETYVERGGTFIKDLFVAPEEEAWADTQLVHTLAAELVEAHRKESVDHGWAWFERTEKWIGNDYLFVEAEGIVGLAPELAAELANLKGREAEIEKELDLAEEQEVEVNDELLFTESREIGRRIMEITEGQTYFTPEQKAKLGVVIDNRFEIHYGMMRRAEAKSSIDPASAERVAEAKEEGKGELSHGMVQELNAILTNAARKALADHALFALDILLLTLIEGNHGLTKGVQVRSGLGVRLDPGPSVEPILMHGMDVCVELLNRIKYGKQKGLQNKMAAIAQLDLEEKLRIFTWLAAQSLQQQHQGSELIVLLNKQGMLDVRSVWTPTVENFFGRLTKKQLQAIADEDKQQVDTGILKRDEAALKVGNNTHDDWLPVVMRPKKK